MARTSDRRHRSSAGPESLSRVLREIDDDRLIELLTDAVARYSPSYAEQPVVELFTLALEKAGLSVRRQPVPASPGEIGRVNLIVELGPQPPALLWVGHLDTIPLLHDEDMGARCEDGILYGLGAADMKSGCAAMAEALIAFHLSGVVPRRGLAAAFVVGEEEYGDGAEVLIGSISAPLTVIGEPTGLVPCFSHHGYFEGHIAAEGTRAHAALPHAGANAIQAVLAWISALLEELRSLPAADGMAFNLREIKGGDSRFVVADRCEALVDVPLPPGTGQDAVSAALERARSAASSAEANVRLEWDISYWASGYSLDPGDPLGEPVRRAFERVGLPFEPGAFRSHSDGNLFHRSGTFCVICGPGQLEAAHTRGEHVSLDEVRRAARVYAALLHEACVTS
jgi:acetylornithine deacetylase